MTHTEKAAHRGQEVCIMHQGFYGSTRRSSCLVRIAREKDAVAVDAIADVLHFAKAKGWDTEAILRMAAQHLDAETLAG